MLQHSSPAPLLFSFLLFLVTPFGASARSVGISTLGESQFSLKQQSLPLQRPPHFSPRQPQRRHRRPSKLATTLYIQIRSMNFNRKSNIRGAGNFGVGHMSHRNPQDHGHVALRTLSSHVPMSSVTSASPHDHRLTIRRLSNGCTERDLSISQSREMGESGVPQYIVQIYDTCTDDGCAPSDVHLNCGWFASRLLVSPDVFRRLAYNDCLVNGGLPLLQGKIIRFTYQNSFMYPLSFKSAQFSFVRGASIGPVCTLPLYSDVCVFHTSKLCQIILLA
ncbi:hypothetical protein KP509_09G000400 [Ceratopteris richardii]|uniref:Uncharacterized protein n=2 Tax=Ceratopteris richardii TaxID=49495 RepID=A0A8T2U1K9_CERRI|nr:hypothetical protein KP509_09G000400 [Ceratopteris richardii]